MNKNRDQETIPEVVDLATGQVEARQGSDVLHSTPIGSCVAVLAYDPSTQIGALAHIMVPGSAPDKTDAKRTRYALDAVESMINQMRELGASVANTGACLAGGANVLQRPESTIGKANILSVASILSRKQIPVRATSLGGTERRTVSLDVATGDVTCVVGDAGAELLWIPPSAAQATTKNMIRKEKLNTQMSSQVFLARTPWSLRRDGAHQD